MLVLGIRLYGLLEECDCSELQSHLVTFSFVKNKTTIKNLFIPDLLQFGFCPYNTLRLFFF